MANPEHVEIVKQGPAAISRWREVHPDERLNLAEANLSDAYLHAADLRGANLRGADLRGADLVGASLGGADLREAYLDEARLFGAHLDNANLSKAYLQHADCGDVNLHAADLSGAELVGVNLTGARLEAANLEGATLWQTILAAVDLSDAKALESISHDGPSIIDENTLRQSWPLPEVFLRGCGLSDELIAFYRATLGKAIEFHSCFISYSSKDQEFADRLYVDLQNKGVRCWLATKDLPIGAKTRDFIDQSIRLHEKLLLVLSANSVKSGWVEKEVATAIETHEKTGRSALFPIRLDDSVMQIDAGWPADVRRIWNIGDFRRWKEDDPYEEAFERLLRDLKAEGKAPPLDRRE